MTILSLEFSAKVRSVAIWIEGADSESQIIVTADDCGSDRIHPLRLIQEALVRASLSAKDIDFITVGLGPGSYTGIRSAIATAQGWSLGRPVKVAGITSVDCIAEQARKAGILGRFHAVVDAQRDEFYVADYESSGLIATLQNPLRILTRPETASLPGPLVGPDLAACGLRGTEIVPSAAVLGLLAKRDDHLIEPSKLIPIYLREVAFIKAPPPRILPK